MTARTIATLSELDALPVEGVLLEASGRYRHSSGTFERCWVRSVPLWITGTDERVWEVLVYGAEIPSSLVYSEDLDLPVAVLHDPSAPAAPSATREDVARSLDPEAWDMPVQFGVDAQASLQSARRERLLVAADALLARFTIAPKTDR